MANELDPPEERDQRGSEQDAPEPRFLVIGEVLKPHGVRGEVRVIPHTELPERFTWLETVYVGEDDPQPTAVEGARFHKGWVLLKLAGYDDRDAAKALRGALLQVPYEEAIPLEEGEYFLYELEGFAVYDETGERLGEVREIIETKANNVFVIDGARGEILLPDIPEVIQEIDFDNGRITVHLLPGLLP